MPYIRSWAALTAATILSLPVFGQDIFTTIRSGDNRAIAAAIEAGADVNARDAAGATPLMYAVIYSDTATMRKLIAKGADVNAAAKSGRTALLTATGRVEKAKLLLESGADINAAAKDGTTPLRSAARNNEAVAAMLLAKGARPNGLVLRAAANAGRAELVRTLLASNAEYSLDDKSAALRGAGQWGYSGIMRQLLAAGADPNGDPTAKGPNATPLMMASHMGDIGLIKELLARGANVNEKGWDNYTALHMATASDRQNPDVLRILIAAGANRNAQDAYGRTPSDLDFKVAPQRVRVEPTATAPAPTVRDAVQRAVNVLQPAGPGFFEQNRCMSCHNQSITQMALKRVRNSGININAEIEAKQRATFSAALAPFREPILNGGIEIPGFLAIASYGLVGLHDDGVEPNEDTASVAHALASRQEADGSFNIYDVRPPLGVSHIKWTALSMRALQFYGPSGAAADYESTIAHAKRFLESAEAHDTQSLAYQILGLRWAGSDAARIEKLARKLAALQRANGGWAQRKDMDTDAFATGQALWALNEGAGWKPTSASARKGAAYLLSTQQPDGSWHVKTRALGFQPRKDTGFPHGKDQWISSAATGYAVLGLAPLIEEQVHRAAR